MCLMPPFDDTNTIGIDTGDLNQDIGEEPGSGMECPSSQEGRFACSLESLAKKPQGRYELIRSIGFGGMKCVLLVHDHDTGREIAMALMPDYKERPREIHEQFIREARITAYLEHPNIVAVHDIGLDSNGAPFYTMSYLRGVPLTTVLKRIREKRPFESRYYTLDRRLRIFQRVCNAVSYAHSCNICHLDIKPENINIGEFGEVRLFDWGIACETDKEGHAVSWDKGKLRGSPGYMAPEQISVNPASPPVGKSSDIFALGALLYSMLTLAPPFSGRNNEEVLLKTLTEDPEKGSKTAPKGMKISRELELICRKAMAKDPADRYQSVMELRMAVLTFQNRSFQSALSHRQRRHLISGIILIFFIFITLAIVYMKNF